MASGFMRLNERHQRPNEHIDFIVPIRQNPDHAIAEDFLNRIAAQCYPVMKKHGIKVRRLDEYEYNTEFLGRNFNGGETIQLVLKDKQGHWLSFKFVQMVMMHELAHCKQMNHSRAFWAVRNEYAKQMEDLWKEKYVGEAIWGRGRDLTSGAFTHDHLPDASQIPEHLCGGTYRKRGRKRKRGDQDGDQPKKVSYAERQQRRIAKKFGKHGEGSTVGEDDLLRGALETMSGGRRRQGKPKVAKSKRGRDLAANAALARIAQAQAQAKKEETPELDDGSDSETESDWDENGALTGSDAVVIKNEEGDDLYRVCGDEEDGEDGAGREMAELRMLAKGSTSRPAKPDSGKTPAVKPPAPGQPGYEDSETESEGEEPPNASELSKTREIDHTNASRLGPLVEVRPNKVTSKPSEHDSTAERLPRPTGPGNDVATTPSTLNCPICSLENEPDSALCIACSNVLRTKLVPGHWRCKSEACKGGKYINPGDFGRCGVCNAPKPAAAANSNAANGRAPGLTRAEVLRWD
ncbi:wlm domain containing protein [Zymoseptoria brevis]|uniref:Wlm domain containing protein n=1 Tax=Zymoseptoria brevis TaxID=1047168 RepID=A0A0F4GCC0_9PEZI|nr:wlm domain containing protein [Zymoseptoria brevis]